MHGFIAEDRAELGEVISSLRNGRRHSDQLAAKFQRGGSLIVGHEAKMPDSHEALRQDVQEKSADELAGLEGHRALLIAVSVIPPTERDLVAVEGKQSMIRDGHAVRITAEIAKNLLGSTKRGLRIDDPFMLVELSDSGQILVSAFASRP
jgi:hypothetical protein